MSFNISILELIALTAILHCLALSLLILFSRFFRSANNKYLGLTLFIIAIVGINNWFWDRGEDPLLISILDLFLWQFLYPLTLFFFFYRNSKKRAKTSLRLKLLFLPFILLTVFNILLSLSTNFHLYTLPAFIEAQITFFYKAVSFLSIIYPIYILCLSYGYMLIPRDSLDAKWLKYLWSFFSIIELYGVLLESHRLIYSEKLALTYLWSVTSIFIYWLIYRGLFQFKLANEQYEIRTIAKHNKATPVALDTKGSYFKQLIHLLEVEKIHHDPHLSRNIVAEKLNISNGYLSQIIKEMTGANFSDFINSYRVEDVKRMIKDENFENYSLLAIGLECGFNSKTAFYTNFKKETGLTPRAYKNQ